VRGLKEIALIACLGVLGACSGLSVKDKLAQARTQVFVLRADLTGIPVQTWDLQGNKVTLVTDAKAGWYLVPNWRVFLKILLSGEMPD
jgi:hypothetical protein